MINKEDLIPLTEDDKKLAEELRERHKDNDIDDSRARMYAEMLKED